MKSSTLENLSFGLVAALLLGLAVLGPVAQPLTYHDFADTRTWRGMANAADVLSNLCFVGMGLWGLHSAARAEPGLQGPLHLFAMGLVLTGLGSAYYHWAPTSATLVWDRLPMTLAFAGAIGAMAYQYVGPAAVHRWQNAWLYLGLVSVALWSVTGDLRLYLVAQAGGFLLGLLWIGNSALRQRRGSQPQTGRLPWHWVWLGYLAAKAAETADSWLWDATDSLLAGHVLKHVFAAAGVAPIWWALRRRPA